MLMKKTYWFVFVATLSLAETFCYKSIIAEGFSEEFSQEFQSSKNAELSKFLADFMDRQFGSAIWLHGYVENG
jgi:hypothetical protein